MYDDGTYTEYLTAPVSRPLFRFLQYLCYILAVVCLLCTVRSFFMVVASAALFLGGWFFGSRSSVEYEYSLLGGELTVDVVFNKASRRTVKTYMMDRVEGIFPFASPSLSAYEGRGLKESDFSSPGEDGQGYVLIYEGSEKIKISPGSEFAAALKKAAPSKFREY
ncbi:MAG: hypothetical protein K6E33_01725 [Lachnospiraceae bacterium]|nr:hypothetical protein [Lachnospiraceae bacterium]